MTAKRKDNKEWIINDKFWIQRENVHNISIGEKSILERYFDIHITVWFFTSEMFFLILIDVFFLAFPNIYNILLIVSSHSMTWIILYLLLNLNLDIAFLVIMHTLLIMPIIFLRIPSSLQTPNIFCFWERSILKLILVRGYCFTNDNIGFIWMHSIKMLKCFATFTKKNRVFSFFDTIFF